MIERFNKKVKRLTSTFLASTVLLSNIVIPTYAHTSDDLFYMSKSSLEESILSINDDTEVFDYSELDILDSDYDELFDDSSLYKLDVEVDDSEIESDVSLDLYYKKNSGDLILLYSNYDTFDVNVQLQLEDNLTDSLKLDFCNLDDDSESEYEVSSPSNASDSNSEDDVIEEISGDIKGKKYKSVVVNNSYTVRAYEIKSSELSKFIDLSVDDEDESEVKNYNLSIAHELVTDYGVYADIIDLSFNNEDFINDVLDLTSYVYDIDGLNLKTDNLKLDKDDFIDFDDEYFGNFVFQYELEEGYEVKVVNQRMTRSIYTGTIKDDIEIVPINQILININYLYEDGNVKANPTSLYISLDEETNTYSLDFKLPELETKYNIHCESDNGYYVIEKRNDDYYLKSSFNYNVEISDVNVVYTTNGANYTVKHYLEGVDETDWVEYSTTVEHGKIGELSTASILYGIDGYTAKDITQKEIKEDGSTVVEVYYYKNTYSLFYDSMGGSSIVYIDAKYNTLINVWDDGSGVVNPMPVKEGYTFEGWYLDKDYTELVPKTLNLKKNTTVYAKWSGQLVDYTEVYLYQVWDNSTNSASYEYYTSVVKQAVVGTEVTNDAPTIDIDYREYSHSDTVVVKADGSTIVNIYYDLIKYTLIFDTETLKGSSIESAYMSIDGVDYKNSYYEIKDVVMDQDISAWWPASTNMIVSNGYSIQSWAYKSSGSGSAIATKRYAVEPGLLTYAYYDDVDKRWEVTYYGKYGNTYRILECHYWLEDITGQYFDEKVEYRQTLKINGYLSAKGISGFEVLEDAVDYIVPSGVDRDGNPYPIVEKYELLYFDKITGEQIDDITGLDSSTYKSVQKYTYNWYYKRNSFDITYHYKSDELLKLEDIKFGADISSLTYNWTPNRPSTLNQYYEFNGWRKDNENSAEYNFAVMPYYNLNLYANWSIPNNDLTVDLNDGQIYAPVQVSKGTIAELEIPIREGYVFLGWYKDKNCTEPYDKTTVIVEDTIIYAKWKEATYTDYTVRYVKIGPSGEYIDIHEEKQGRALTHSSVQESALNFEGTEYEDYAVDHNIKIIEDLVVENNELVFIYTSPLQLWYRVFYVCTTNDDVLVIDAGEDGTGIKANAIQFRVTPDEEIISDLNKKGYFLAESESFKMAKLNGDYNQENNIVYFYLDPAEYTINYLGVKKATGWELSDVAKENLGDISPLSLSENPNPLVYDASSDHIYLMNPVRKGFKFLGWRTKQGRVDGVYSDDPFNIVIEKESIGDLEFTAYWEELSSGGGSSSGGGNSNKPTANPTYKDDGGPGVVNNNNKEPDLPVNKNENNTPTDNVVNNNVDSSVNNNPETVETDKVSSDNTSSINNDENLNVLGVQDEKTNQKLEVIPITGDESNTAFYLLLMITSLVSLILLIKYDKKNMK